MIRSAGMRVDVNHHRRYTGGRNGIGIEHTLMDHVGRERPGRHKIHINGRFLEQPLSGVQRYAREMVLALDRLLSHEEGARGEQWILLTSRRGAEALELERIEMRTVPSSLRGHAWEQLALARASRAGSLIGFGGSGPISHARQLVVIHDASVFRHPELYSRSYGLFHRTLDRILARRARIATVSGFSQRELAEVLGLTRERIPIFYNGSDHMKRLAPNHGTVERLGLRGRNYFVLVGNLNRNKNVGAALEALTHVEDVCLILVGGLDQKVFGSVNVDLSNERVLLAGRLDDEDVAGLLTDARGLIFPSLYEGFGIPPLEAMAHGCPVIASDIPAVKEVCGDAALYFDSHNAGELAAKIQGLLSEPEEQRQQRCERGRERAAQFTWNRSAEQLLDFCRGQLFPVTEDR
jgi:glycosyltransferase involved in cell wall biosynthesis